MFKTITLKGGPGAGYYASRITIDTGGKNGKILDSMVIEAARNRGSRERSESQKIMI